MFKTCKVCGETKDAVPGTWVVKHGKPDGLTCRACANEAFRIRISSSEGWLKSQQYSQNIRLGYENLSKGNKWAS